MTLRPGLVLASAAVTLVSACGAAPEDAPYAFGAGDQYVALGDSYVAAPGIGAPDGDDGCFRSQDNYPHLVAKATGLALTDHSCAGAKTDSITGGQRGLTGRQLAPQLDAVDSGTDVVTVGIGGNDFGLYNLLASICATLALKSRDGSPCADADRVASPGQGLASKLEEIEVRATDVIRAIQERAPDAMVIAVGYPAIVPERGTCSELRVGAGDVSFLHRLNLGLNDALSNAARTAGATYVDVYARSKGHDICSADPWIAGAKASHGPAAAWHPYAAEQRAAASAVQDALRER